MYASLERTGPSVQRSERPLLACHTLRKIEVLWKPLVNCKRSISVLVHDLLNVRLTEGVIVYNQASECLITRMSEMGTSMFDQIPISTLELI